MKNKVREYWEGCHVAYAHLTTNRNLSDPKNKAYAASLRKIFIDHIDWKDKIIIDYGIGGGYLGLYLFENYGLKKYVGIDIAQRSLDFARLTLLGYKIRLYLAPKDYSQFDIDVFVSIACIQHFPDEKYFIDFLSDINNSKVKKVCLIFKYAEITRFNDAYENDEGYGGACLTNKDYIMRRLTNFKLTDTTANNNKRVLICDNVK